MTSSEKAVCFYCSEYAKVVKDYSINPATNDREKFTPRCHLHWKYECGNCGDMKHFNGISWCSDCKTFTCLSCAEERMVRKKFLVYDYYYEIPCNTCGSYNAALDFAEFDGTHPFQNGDIQPEGDISVWKPLLQDEIESQDFPHRAWGSERIISLGKRVNYEKLETLDEYSPKTVWDALAPKWVENIRGGDEYHHTFNILPEVYRLLDVQNSERILDVACGEGNVARHLASSGAKVTGIDISKMLDFAIAKEKEKGLGIDYQRLNAEELDTIFEDSSFDKVVCNMALMDIADYKTTLKQISRVLRNEGIFVFSITHPAFVFPSCMGIRVPIDSERNEDRIRFIIDYFDERPTIVRDFTWLPAPFLQFHRPISSYVNDLAKNSFQIVEMSEPKVSDEVVQKYPREAYWDDERRPEFLIVKAMKRSD